MYNWHGMLSKHLSTKGKDKAQPSYVTRNPTGPRALTQEPLQPKTTIKKSACNEPFAFVCSMRRGFPPRPFPFL